MPFLESEKQERAHKKQRKKEKVGSPTEGART